MVAVWSTVRRPREDRATAARRARRRSSTRCCGARARVRSATARRRALRDCDGGVKVMDPVQVAADIEARRL